jgi:hypothetical protein
VFDNIEKKNEELVLGSDSIGCTIFCGENSIEKIYWCGSILSSSDENVDINEICNKYNCEIGELYKIEIEDCMYNNNYTICNSYKKEGPRFYLKLE